MLERNSKKRVRKIKCKNSNKCEKRTVNTGVVHWIYQHHHYYYTHALIYIFYQHHSVHKCGTKDNRYVILLNYHHHYHHCYLINYIAIWIYRAYMCINIRFGDPVTLLSLRYVRTSLAAMLTQCRACEKVLFHMDCDISPVNDVQRQRTTNIDWNSIFAQTKFLSSPKRTFISLILLLESMLLLAFRDWPCFLIANDMIWIYIYIHLLGFYL